MKKILVVIDMQNDFIDGSLGTKEAVKIIPNVVNKINSISSTDVVIFTKDTHFDNYLNTLEGKSLPVKHCIQGTNGWCINKDVRSAWIANPSITFKDAGQEIKYNTIEKSTFGSVNLAKLINNWNDTFKICAIKNKDIDLGWEQIEEIELVGLCTDICVISNALLLKAYFPEIQITVDASCCAGVSPESHLNALKAMKVCQINVINE